MPINIAPGITLAEHERLIWRGRPDALAALRTHLPFLFVGLPVLGLGLWFYLRSEAFTEAGGVAALIGLAISAAPALVAGRAIATTYVITDRRVVLAASAFGRMDVVERALPALDAELEILPSRDGTGHLYLASDCSRKSGHVDGFGKLAFRDIANPERVRDMLEKARSRAFS